MNWLRRRLVILYGIAAVTLVVPLVVTWHAVRDSAQQRVLAQAEETAAAILRAAELVSDQSVEAIEAVVKRGAKHPCDEAAVIAMRQELVRNKLLQDVGYVRADWLRCSALLASPHYLGPFDYHSEIGNEIRASVAHPLAPSVRSMALTHAESGYTVFIRPDLLLDLFPSDAASQSGLVNMSTQKVIVTKGGLPADMGMLPPARGSSFVEVRGPYVVAWRASKRYDFGAVAILATDSIDAVFRENIVWVLPTVVGGFSALSFVLYLLARTGLSMPVEFKRAIKRSDEFFLVYQPIVELRTGAWVGVEALLRWRRASGELVPPDVFIPMAERRGLISLVTQRVLTLLQRDLPSVLKQHPQMEVAINLCAEDLRSPRVVEQIEQLLATLDMPARHLHVEITERVAVDMEQARGNIVRLRTRGVRVSLDDFGTGYSSLSYLSALELDQIKIDRSFVAAIDKALVTSHVVEHVIELARSMRLDMVAEGVETGEQADFLRVRGVQYAQGWHFAKAMSAWDLINHWPTPNFTPVTAADPAR